jgi:hypothetical protein
MGAPVAEAASAARPPSRRHTGFLGTAGSRRSRCRVPDQNRSARPQDQPSPFLPPYVYRVARVAAEDMLPRRRSKLLGPAQPPTRAVVHPAAAAAKAHLDATRAGHRGRQTGAYTPGRALPVPRSAGWYGSRYRHRARSAFRLPGRDADRAEAGRPTISKRTIQAGKCLANGGRRPSPSDRPSVRTSLTCWFVVEPPAGIEPATPSLPSMRRWFTTPPNTSRPRTTAHVRSAVEGCVVGRGEVTCGVDSGKFLAEPCEVAWPGRLSLIVPTRPRRGAAGISGAVLFPDWGRGQREKPGVVRYGGTQVAVPVGGQ